MRKLLVAALAGVLLLVVAGDPSMGTQVDLDPTNQVAGQIVGENHAKPLPRPGAHLAELLHSLVRALTWILAAVVVVPVVRMVVDASPAADPSAVGWSHLAHRGPPGRI